MHVRFSRNFYLRIWYLFIWLSNEYGYVYEQAKNTINIVLREIFSF